MAQREPLAEADELSLWAVPPFACDNGRATGVHGVDATY